MKFIIPILILLISFSAFSNRYLVSVNDLPRGVIPDSHIIERINGISFVYTDENRLRSLTARNISMQNLEANSSELAFDYFIVYPMYVDFEDIKSHCTILGNYDDFLVVKVSSAQKNKFLSLETEKNQLRFTPYTFESNHIPGSKKLTYSTEIQKAVDEFSKDSVRSYVKVLQDFPSRHSSMNEPAVQWIVEKFTSFGVDSVFTQDVPGYGKNIIAVIYGSEHNPLEYCFFDAHMDAVDKNGVRAAGADDNASGTGNALEIARVLATKKFTHTIRIICFNGEESGLQGSAVYARDAKNKGHKVIGAGINVDMCGYSKTPATRVCWVHYDSTIQGNTEAAQVFQASAKQYVGFENVRLTTKSGVMGASDQASFWRNGFPCLLASEAKERTGICPNYHKPGDLLDDPNALNDSELMAMIGKTSLATLAHYINMHTVGIANGFVKGNSAVSIRKYNDKIKLSFLPTENGIVEIFIVNSKGVALQKSSSFVQKNVVRTLQVERLHSKGVYFIQIKQGNKILQKGTFTL